MDAGVHSVFFYCGVCFFPGSNVDEVSRLKRLDGSIQWQWCPLI